MAQAVTAHVAGSLAAAGCHFNQGSIAFSGQELSPWESPLLVITGAVDVTTAEGAAGSVSRVQVLDTASGETLDTADITATQAHPAAHVSSGAHGVGLLVNDTLRMLPVSATSPICAAALASDSKSEVTISLPLDLASALHAAWTAAAGSMDEVRLMTLLASGILDRLDTAIAVCSAGQSASDPSTLTHVPPPAAWKSRVWFFADRRVLQTLCQLKVRGTAEAAQAAVQLQLGESAAPDMHLESHRIASFVTHLCDPLAAFDESGRKDTSKFKAFNTDGPLNVWSVDFQPAYKLAAAGFFAVNAQTVQHATASVQVPLSVVWHADPDTFLLQLLSSPLPSVQLNVPASFTSSAACTAAVLAAPPKCIASSQHPAVPVTAVGMCNGAVNVLLANQLEPIKSIAAFTHQSAGLAAAHPSFPWAEATISAIAFCSLDTPTQATPHGSATAAPASSPASDQKVPEPAVGPSVPPGSSILSPSMLGSLFSSGGPIATAAAAHRTNTGSRNPWPVEGADVMVVAGDFAGATGRVVEATQTGQPVVFLHGLELVTQIDKSQLQPVPASVGDVAVVADGPNAGRRVFVKRAMGTTGAVVQDITSNSVFVCKLASLYKLSGVSFPTTITSEAPLTTFTGDVCLAVAWSVSSNAAADSLMAVLRVNAGTGAVTLLQTLQFPQATVCGLASLWQQPSVLVNLQSRIVRCDLTFQPPRLNTTPVLATAPVSDCVVLPGTVLVAAVTATHELLIVDAAHCVVATRIPLPPQDYVAVTAVATQSHGGTHLLAVAAASGHILKVAVNVDTSAAAVNTLSCADMCDTMDYVTALVDDTGLTWSASLAHGATELQIAVNASTTTDALQLSINPKRGGSGPIKAAIDFALREPAVVSCVRFVDNKPAQFLELASAGLAPVVQPTKWGSGISVPTVPDLSAVSVWFRLLDCAHPATVPSESAVLLLIPAHVLPDSLSVIHFAPLPHATWADDHCIDIDSQHQTSIHRVAVSQQSFSLGYVVLPAPLAAGQYMVSYRAGAQAITTANLVASDTASDPLSDAPASVQPLLQIVPSASDPAHTLGLAQVTVCLSPNNRLVMLLAGHDVAGQPCVRAQAADCLLAPEQWTHIQCTVSPVEVTLTLADSQVLSMSLNGFILGLPSMTDSLHHAAAVWTEAGCMADPGIRLGYDCFGQTAHVAFGHVRIADANSTGNALELSLVRPMDAALPTTPGPVQYHHVEWVPIPPNGHVHVQALSLLSDLVVPSAVTPVYGTTSVSLERPVLSHHVRVHLDIPVASNVCISLLGVPQCVAPKERRRMLQSDVVAVRQLANVVQLWNRACATTLSVSERMHTVQLLQLLSRWASQLSPRPNPVPPPAAEMAEFVRLNVIRPFHAATVNAATAMVLELAGFLPPEDQRTLLALLLPMSMQLHASAGCASSVSSFFQILKTLATHTQQQTDLAHALQAAIAVASEAATTAIVPATTQALATYWDVHDELNKALWHTTSSNDLLPLLAALPTPPSSVSAMGAQVSGPWTKQSKSGPVGAASGAAGSLPIPAVPTLAAPSLSVAAAVGADLSSPSSTPAPTGKAARADTASPTIQFSANVRSGADACGAVIDLGAQCHVSALHVKTAINRHKQAVGSAAVYIAGLDSIPAAELAALPQQANDCSFDSSRSSAVTFVDPCTVQSTSNQAGALSCMVFSAPGVYSWDFEVAQAAVHGEVTCLGIADPATLSSWQYTHNDSMILLRLYNGEVWNCGQGTRISFPKRIAQGTVYHFELDLIALTLSAAMDDHEPVVLAQVPPDRSWSPCVAFYGVHDTVRLLSSSTSSSTPTATRTNFNLMQASLENRMATFLMLHGAMMPRKSLSVLHSVDFAQFEGNWKCRYLVICAHHVDDKTATSQPPSLQFNLSITLRGALLADASTTTQLRTQWSSVHDSLSRAYSQVSSAVSTFMDEVPDLPHPRQRLPRVVRGPHHALARRYAECADAVQALRTQEATVATPMWQALVNVDMDMEDRVSGGSRCLDAMGQAAKLLTECLQQPEVATALVTSTPPSVPTPDWCVTLYSKCALHALASSSVRTALCAYLATYLRVLGHHPQATRDVGMRCLHDLLADEASQPQYDPKLTFHEIVQFIRAEHGNDRVAAHLHLMSQVGVAATMGQSMLLGWLLMTLDTFKPLESAMQPPFVQKTIIDYVQIVRKICELPMSEQPTLLVLSLQQLSYFCHACKEELLVQTLSPACGFPALVLALCSCTDEYVAQAVVEFIRGLWTILGAASLWRLIDVGISSAIDSLPAPLLALELLHLALKGGSAQAHTQHLGLPAAQRLIAVWTRAMPLRPVVLRLWQLVIRALTKFVATPALQAAFAPTEALSAIFNQVVAADGTVQRLLLPDLEPFVNALLAEKPGTDAVQSSRARTACIVSILRGVSAGLPRAVLTSVRHAFDTPAGPRGSKPVSQPHIMSPLGDLLLCMLRSVNAALQRAALVVEDTHVAVAISHTIAGCIAGVLDVLPPVAAPPAVCNLLLATLQTSSSLMNSSGAIVGSRVLQDLVQVGSLPRLLSALASPMTDTSRDGDDAVPDALHDLFTALGATAADQTTVLLALLTMLRQDSAWRVPVQVSRISNLVASLVSSAGVAQSVITSLGECVGFALSQDSAAASSILAGLELEVMPVIGQPNVTDHVDNNFQDLLPLATSSHDTVGKYLKQLQAKSAPGGPATAASFPSTLTSAGDFLASAVDNHIQFMDGSLPMAPAGLEAMMAGAASATGAPLSGFPAGSPLAMPSTAAGGGVSLMGVNGAASDPLLAMLGKISGVPTYNAGGQLVFQPPPPSGSLPFAFGGALGGAAPPAVPMDATVHEGDAAADESDEDNLEEAEHHEGDDGVDDDAEDEEVDAGDEMGPDHDEMMDDYAGDFDLIDPASLTAPLGMAPAVAAPASDADPSGSIAFHTMPNTLALSYSAAGEVYIPIQFPCAVVVQSVTVQLDPKQTRSNPDFITVEIEGCAGLSVAGCTRVPGETNAVEVRLTYAAASAALGIRFTGDAKSGAFFVRGLKINGRFSMLRSVSTSNIEDASSAVVALSQQLYHVCERYPQAEQTLAQSPLRPTLVAAFSQALDDIHIGEIATVMAARLCGYDMPSRLLLIKKLLQGSIRSAAVPSLLQQLCEMPAVSADAVQLVFNSAVGTLNQSRVKAAHVSVQALALLLWRNPSIVQHVDVSELVKACFAVAMLHSASSDAAAAAVATTAQQVLAGALRAAPAGFDALAAEVPFSTELGSGTAGLHVASAADCARLLRVLAVGFSQETVFHNDAMLEILKHFGHSAIELLGIECAGAADADTRQVVLALLDLLAAVVAYDNGRAWVGDTLLRPLFDCCCSQDSRLSATAQTAVLQLVAGAVNLHPANQRLVADHIAAAIADGRPLSEFVQKLMVRMASLVEIAPVLVTVPAGIVVRRVSGRQAGRSSTAVLQSLNKRLESAAFDPQLSNQYVTIVNERTVRLPSPMEAAAVVGVGFQGGGLYEWVFNLDEDAPGGQCSCFGAAVVPVASHSYSNSQQLWLLRAFNGRLYHGPRSASKFAVVPVGESVTVQLDLDEGTISMSTAAAPMTVCFRDIPSDQAIHPAVAFYGSTPVMRLVSVKVLRLPASQAMAQALCKQLGVSYSAASSAGVNSSGVKDASNGLLPVTARVVPPSLLTMYTATASVAASVGSDFRCLCAGTAWDVDHQGRKVDEGVASPSQSLVDRQLKSLTAADGLVVLRCSTAHDAQSSVTQQAAAAGGDGRSIEVPVFALLARRGVLPGLVRVLDGRLTELASRQEPKKQLQHVKDWKLFVSTVAWLCTVPSYAMLVVEDSTCIAAVEQLLSFLSRDNLGALPAGASDARGAALAPLQRALVSWSGSQLATLRQELVDKQVLQVLLVRIGRLLAVDPRKQGFGKELLDGIVAEDMALDPEAAATAGAGAGGAGGSGAAAPSRRGARANGPWTAGTGYGHGGPDSSADSKLAEHQQRVKQRQAQALVLLHTVEAFVHGAEPFPEGVATIVGDSCLLPLLTGFMMSSELDMFKDIPMHLLTYKILLGLGSHVETLRVCVGTKDEEKTNNPYKLVEHQAQLFEDLVDEGRIAAEMELIDTIHACKAAMDRTIARAAELAAAAAAAAAASASATPSAAPAPGGEEDDSDTKAGSKDDESKPELVRVYERSLQAMQLRKINLKDESGVYRSVYAGELAHDASTTSAKNMLKRVQAELRSMKKSLPLDFSSTICLRYDAARPYVMQALIFGPHDTPYDSGAFIFDIYCPPDYPNAAPRVSIVTTGGGTVRFNPNLYNTGKVCLSLLGTWRGGARSEEWSPDSTILQVLVSIQALIFVEKPYYNEPGVESQMGSREGEYGERTSSNGGYEGLRVATAQWAIVDQLRHPPEGFEDAVKQHFLLQRAHIFQVFDRWLAEAAASDTAGHFEALQRQTEAARIELNKLGPSPCDVLVPTPPATADAAAATPTTADAATERDISVELATMKEICGHFPTALLKHALQVSDYNLDAALGWVISSGEEYLALVMASDTKTDGAAATKLLTHSATKAKASTVLQGNKKEYGPQHMFDGIEDTCWNSDSGTTQSVVITLDAPSRVSGIHIMFQGGFVPRECEISTAGDDKVYTAVSTVYPKDVNTMQIRDTAREAGGRCLTQCVLVATRIRSRHSKGQLVEAELLQEH